MTTELRETDQLRLVQALREPSAWPHSCRKIRVIETHISWVFLTGEFAYKLKKNVDLGFVDFTTLERRRHFCHEELRLNRRLAPDLYVNVVPVNESNDGIRVNGPGEIRDFLVCMNQFDPDRMLCDCSDVLYDGECLHDLADRLGAFHRSATVAPLESPFGSPEEILRDVRDNFSVLEQADVSIGSCVRLLAEDAETEFERLLPVFRRRRTQGMIRECHGDLHLGNMFVQNDRIHVFDGIEFREEFRWIDIISDLAFVIMDLQDRGIDRPARLLLNWWLEVTGDYGGLAVLPFYCAYRAAVRAKVDVLRMRQPGLTFSDQRNLCKDCSTYLSLAGRYACPHRPTLVITTGPSGSGKTWATEQLIAATDMIRIRSDVERKRMHHLEPLQVSTDEQKQKLYSASATEATYDRLAELAEEIINAGFPVVVDATFLRFDERSRFLHLADRLKVPFLILECVAPVDILRQRIADRQSGRRDASEADESVLEAQLEHTDLLTPSELEVTIQANDANFVDVLLARAGIA